MSASKWFGGLLVGAVIATGCGSEQDSGPTGEDRGGVPSEGDAFPAAGETLFEDSFDDDRNNWGVVDDPDFGSAVYANGDYVWEFRGRVAHWIAGELGDQYDRGELAMLDVVVRAEATIVEGGGVIGVSCRETPDTNAEWQWYEFVARDGFAAIRIAGADGRLDVLLVRCLRDGDRVVVDRRANLEGLAALRRSPLPVDQELERGRSPFRDPDGLLEERGKLYGRRLVEPRDCFG